MVKHRKRIEAGSVFCYTVYGSVLPSALPSPIGTLRPSVFGESTERNGLHHNAPVFLGEDGIQDICGLWTGEGRHDEI